jgi:ribosomal protein L16 Arg81 hydroxylase
MPLTLDELLRGELEGVRQSLVGRQAFLIRGNAPDRFAKIFDWNGIETVLGGSHHAASDFSMFLGGKALDLQFLGVFAREGGFQASRFRSLTRQGATVGGAHLERSFPEIAALANQACAVFRAVVRCAFVASYGTVTGYPVHYDCDDLIICQVSGRKRWEFFGSPVAGSGFPFRDEGPVGELALTIELNPGDVLIVPSGLRHRCTPLEPSLHFGFAMTWPTGVWIARRVMEAAVARSVAREPIRSFAPSEGRLALEQAVRDELAEVLRDLNFEDARAQFLLRFLPGDHDAKLR